MLSEHCVAVGPTPAAAAGPLLESSPEAELRPRHTVCSEWLRGRVGATWVCILSPKFPMLVRRPKHLIKNTLLHKASTGELCTHSILRVTLRDDGHQVRAEDL